MKNNKLIRLAKRREHLIAQAAAQRRILAQNVAPWRTPLALADQGLAILRFIKSHPVWVAGSGLLLATRQPGATWKWLSRGWAAWQMVRKLRSN